MGDHARTITFIGGGNMAQALIGGLIARGAVPRSLRVVEPNEATRALLIERFGVDARADAAGALAGAAAVVLSVKPQVLREVALGLAAEVGDALVISIAAGIRARDIARWIGSDRVVRTMPNTPALIGEGITGLAALPACTTADQGLADELLGAVGRTVWVDDESKLDAVTAISGSGPAYVFLFIEALEAAGVRMGLGATEARALAIQTFAGGAQLAARSDDSPAVLREKVTSKGGTTFAALTTMRDKAVPESIIAGALAAAARSAELGDEFGRD
ncbi:pyrroline-5-carboxylate reductase [Derxia gummosa]|uniref:Pyrroline-5-carboxylate reductase n=1 Tax=Derxia gummosa DSM 723 TaxID=1121388 RepID=A0A8B6X1Y4_9BURK|nr:pyrroline-5-carboxylate reductase [Derxia gummosa]